MFKKLFVAALAALSLMPSVAKAGNTDNLVFRGVMLDWYTYDKNRDTNKTEWYQIGPGYYDMQTGQLFSNQGLFEVALDPQSSKDDKFVGMDFVFRHNVCYGNAGAVYTRNALYTFFLHETEESQMSEEGGEYEILVRKWDVEKGTYQNVGRLQNSPTDLTYDPYTGKVYGMFYLTSSVDGELDYTYELCELDMNTFEVRQISHAGFDIYNEPRAIAINSKGEIYGISQRGVVLKFNKDNGSYTEVGNIGFRTQEKMMSAAFDFRTDKLYFLGYKNDGIRDHADTSGTNNHLTIAEGGRDTAIYEINTETGAATLLSNCEQVDIDIEAAKVTKVGKIMLTGLWIEGSYDDIPDAIVNVNADARGTGVTYNVAGQRVADSQKGFVIRDGKKFIQK